MTNTAKQKKHFRHEYLKPAIHNNSHKVPAQGLLKYCLVLQSEQVDRIWARDTVIDYQDGEFIMSSSSGTTETNAGFGKVCLWTCNIHHTYKCNTYLLTKTASTLCSGLMIIWNSYSAGHPETVILYMHVLTWWIMQELVAVYITRANDWQHSTIYLNTIIMQIVVQWVDSQICVTMYSKIENITAHISVTEYNLMCTQRISLTVDSTSQQRVAGVDKPS